jgi:hypothetical protein
MRIIGRLPCVYQLRTSVLFLKSFGIGLDQIRVLSTYLAGKLFTEYSDEIHLKATMEWLARAQDVCGGDGVANVFYLKNGWGIAYPETSGYILATYLAYADYSNDKSYIERAVKIGDWEIDIQAANGGVFSSTELRQTRVFNTGQVILGWCKLFEYTDDKKYLKAAIRAGNYLLEVQETDGTWRRDTYCGARTYHARVDWALLRLAQLSGEQRYVVAAVNNLRWVLQQQQLNGWFDQCGFNNDPPIIHVIVYTLRGLLECSLMNNTAVDDLEILPAVTKATDALCKAMKTQFVANIVGMVPTSFDEKWQSPALDSCLTGNAQLVCFLYALGHAIDNQGYRVIADGVLSVTKQTQLVDSSLSAVKGAIPGTYPISHGYVCNGYPNWAAKFFADALLMKINFAKRLVISA